MSINYQFPLIIELVLLNGYIDEAETVFCLSDELSKDMGLCYFMVRLTKRGLISRCASEGNYNTVKNLIEFYRDQRLCDPGLDGCPMEKVAHTVENEGRGPMFWALCNDHIDIYKLLRTNMDVFEYICSEEWRLPDLLNSLIGCSSYEATMIVLNEVTLDMCTPLDIKNMTKRLIDEYYDWADKCAKKEELSYGKYWGDELYCLAKKLKIGFEDYMWDQEISIGSCRCEYCYHGDYYITDDFTCKEFNQKMREFHLDGYALAAGCEAYDEELRRAWRSKYYPSREELRDSMFKYMAERKKRKIISQS
jgi:hypothetical protein